MRNPEFIRGEPLMKLSHPFEWLPIARQTRAFIVLFALTMIVMVVLQILGGPLKTDVAPIGIVSFELAGTLPLAQTMVESWGELGRIFAGLNLGLDFLFIVLYANCIGLGCVIVARNLSLRGVFLAATGIVPAWALWFAALLDCIENFALINLLLGSRNPAFAVIARWCAIPKFLIVGLCILYVILGMLAIGIVKPKNDSPRRPVPDRWGLHNIPT